MPTFKPITSPPTERDFIPWAALQAFDGRFCGFAWWDAKAQAVRFHGSRKAAQAEITSRKHRGAVWMAHDLDSNLAALFGRSLPKGWQLSASGTGIAFGRVRIGKKITARVWDILGHYRGVSLEELGESVGHAPVQWVRPDTYLSRPSTSCREYVEEVLTSRVEVIRRATDKLQAYYKRHGASVEVSAAGSALKAWRRTDLPKMRFQFWVPPQPWKLSWMRGAFYGGRQEAVQVGDVAGPMQTFDVRSCYPYLCTVTPLPLVSDPWTDVVGHPKNWETRPSIVEATVEVPEMLMPPLPWRRQSGEVIYPTGTIRGRWHGCELRNAIENGVKIKEIHCGMIFSSSDLYLAEHARRYWAERKLYPKGTPEEILSKALLTSLVGKFAQRSRGGEILSIDEEASWRRARKARMGGGDDYQEPGLLYWPPDSDQVTAAIFSEPTKLVDDQEVAAQHVNVFWTSEIHAQGRVYLYKQIQAELERLLWCHTDAVMLAGLQPVKGLGEGLGDWSLETSWESVRIIQPAIYGGTVAGGQYKAKASGIHGQEEARDLIEHGYCSFPGEVSLHDWILSGGKSIPGTCAMNWRKIRQEYDRRRWSEEAGCTVPLQAEGPDLYLAEEWKR